MLFGEYRDYCAVQCYLLPVGSLNFVYFGTIDARVANGQHCDDLQFLHFCSFAVYVHIPPWKCFHILDAPYQCRVFSIQIFQFSWKIRLAQIPVRRLVSPKIRDLVSVDYRRRQSILRVVNQFEWRMEFEFRSFSTDLINLCVFFSSLSLRFNSLLAWI